MSRACQRLAHDKSSHCRRMDSTDNTEALGIENGRYGPADAGGAGRGGGLAEMSILQPRGTE